ncbi:inovirus Gp2 family protein [Pontibacterium granulatum]|uniref:inovirus Gp2 family protein n=1 Tax=Pontibacterium granulatum TaxID=2036029 RepID=UPI00249B3A02|nr:inovirus Gp2 family protein [Pontibacterium granulatum]MDI3323387.1 inovirus Gp2 family protein [Pontibacterium granulatum]
MNSNQLASYGPLNNHYQSRIEETIQYALSEYPRTLAIRVDLRLPDQVGSLYGSSDDPLIASIRTDSAVISRFFASLNAQISADVQRKIVEGKRAYPCTLRYVWVREKNKQHKDHYHVVLLLNKDAYHTLGSYQSSGPNLANRIRKAWLSALGLYPDTEVGFFGSLVHFPENPYYILNVNDPAQFNETYRNLIFRTSYLAKKETKHYDDGNRWFGCSRR